MCRIDENNDLLLLCLLLSIWAVNLARMGQKKNITTCAESLKREGLRLGPCDASSPSHAEAGLQF
jgi:hypothetical protein